MNTILLDDNTKNEVLGEIKTLIGNPSIPKIFENNIIISLSSGLWLVSTEIYNYIMNTVGEDIQIKFLRYSGIYLGSIRKQFGLSLESLYFIKNDLKRFIILKGKQLQKFLYGRTVVVEVDYLDDSSYSKIVIVTQEKEPVGIGKISILERNVNRNLTIEISSIVDLGLYLRKEDSIFQ